MPESYEFDATQWITAGAIGPPGERTFYIQARQDRDFVALLVEKEQVRALAKLAQDLLARVDVTVMPDDLDVERHELVDPVIEAWRVGTLSLGMDATGERFLLEAEEASEEEEEEEEEEAEHAKARFWLTRPQLVGLAAYAAYAVEAGARERCRLCGRPKDPGGGHVCPASNGHGPLTR